MSRENRSQETSPARYPRTAPAPVASRRPAPQAEATEAARTWRRERLAAARTAAQRVTILGIPAAGEASPSWLDDTPDWYPFP